MKKITSILFVSVVLSLLFLASYSSAADDSLFFKDLEYRCVGPSR